ncbi:MAG: AraC family transcriptional regulator [Polyangiales bacterium]
MGRSPKLTAAAARPLLFSWGARALFVGASLHLTPHRNAVAVLAVSLDGPFTLTNADGAVRCRSALIEPNTRHHLRAGAHRMAFLYVDATGRDLTVLREAFPTLGRLASTAIRAQAALSRALRALAEGRATFADTRAYLDARLLRAPSPPVADPVVASLRFLHAHAADRPTLAALAQEARLSPSRYRHRFVALTGVPFRRYRTWVAMGAALRQVAAGASLTEAAHAAGFASSAHFSTAFRAMFGLAPSRLRDVVLATDPA